MGTRLKYDKEVEQEDSEDGEETHEREEHTLSDSDDTDEESKAGVPTNVYPKAKNQSSDNTLNNVKKSAHNESNVEDVVFKKLLSGDLKLKVAENVNKSYKSNSIGI
jgi:hypothetical protein